MRPTRRGWASAFLGGLCCILAALLESTVVLLTGVAALAPLLAAQVHFLHTVSRLAEETRLTRSFTPERARVDEPVTVVVECRFPAVPRGETTLSTNPPVGFSSQQETTTTVPPDEETVHVAAAGTLPTAGSFMFDPPIIFAEDPLGLFTQNIAIGDAHELTVEPRGPREVHVGAGGSRIGLAYGEHTAAQGSAGLEPSEIRRYSPGDPTNRIDWKATARLNEPHIREFEAETDQPAVLVLDSRSTMRQGPVAETKLDHARDLGLWFADYAERFSDPLGFWLVTDDGLGDQHAPASTADAYRRIRTRLQSLTAVNTTGRRHRRLDRSLDGRRKHGGREAHSAAAATADRDSAFDRTIAAYVSEARPFVARVEDQPLYRVVTTGLSRVSGRPLVVLVTDDERRVEVRETVKTARRRGRAVVVFLLPSVLFEDRDSMTLDDAYEKYLSFEEFRRELGGLDDVTAYEVGPTDRLNAILAAGQSPRSRSR